MNNRFSNLFSQKKTHLSIFVTAGYPKLDSTVEIIKALCEKNVSFIELGIPFSDSIADGPTIQSANEIAIANGVTSEFTLEILREIRKFTEIPVALMGGLNPILQYGVEKFCQDASESGADALIIPELPFDFYIENYRNIFEKYNLSNIFLVTPNTSDERIKMIDEATSAFIYAVSISGVTGNKLAIDEQKINYFTRLKNLNLKSPIAVGFGVENISHFNEIGKFADAVIVGSAFVKSLGKHDLPSLDVDSFFEEFYTG